MDGQMEGQRQRGIWISRDRELDRQKQRDRWMERQKQRDRLMDRHIRTDGWTETDRPMERWWLGGIWLTDLDPLLALLLTTDVGDRLLARLWCMADRSWPIPGPLWWASRGPCRTNTSCICLHKTTHWQTLAAPVYTKHFKINTFANAAVLVQG